MMKRRDRDAVERTTPRLRYGRDDLPDRQKGAIGGFDAKVLDLITKHCQDWEIETCGREVAAWGGWNERHTRIAIARLEKRGLLRRIGARNHRYILIVTRDYKTSEAALVAEGLATGEGPELQRVPRAARRPSPKPKARRPPPPPPEEQLVLDLLPNATSAPENDFTPLFLLPLSDHMDPTGMDQTDPTEGGDLLMSRSGSLDLPPSPTPPEAAPPAGPEGGRVVAALTPPDETPAPNLTIAPPEPNPLPVPEEALDAGIQRPDPADPIVHAALRGAFGRRYTAATIWRHWLAPALLRVAGLTRADLVVYLRECGANHEIRGANCPPGVAFARNRIDVWWVDRVERRKPPPIPLPPAEDRPMCAPRIELPRDPLSPEEIAARAATLARALAAPTARRPVVPRATLTPEARALLAAERHNEEST